MSGVVGQTGDWNRDLQTRPAAIAVARLLDTHGLAVCCERWPSLHPRTINSLARAGRKQLERREAVAVSHNLLGN